MFFVYRLRNLVDGRCFISYQQSDDPYWCNPICRLSSVHETTGVNKRMHFPTQVLEDIKKHGAHNFSIEAIAGAATREEADRHLGKIVTPAFREDPNNYNRPLGRKKNTK